MTDQLIDKAHGGRRQGAGRKKGTGKFGEATKVMRVPVSKVASIQAWLNSEKSGLDNAYLANQNRELSSVSSSAFYWHRPANDSEFVALPLYEHKVVAGFPSPAEDYVEARLDLNEKLIHNKEATFLLTVQGDSMKDVGIMDGDILVVDRSISPQDGKIVIAAVNDELTVKRLSIKSTGTWLVPENDDFPPILVKEGSELVIWGVVTATISQFK